MVLRPALASVDDETLVKTMGNVHRIADRRMPIPGAAGWIATGLAAATALLDGQRPVFLLATLAFVFLAAWMAIYLTISAPINKQLSTAPNHPTGVTARELQTRWDSVIYARATLQTHALLSLCLALLTAH
ncbi:DUF1772 domain-containing protein [Nocardia sp. SYP-A9097]|nr:DUF1772 domain-containing protein [Nocardia sp. SYP-A9097]